MAVAIFTRYLGPTETRGARIKASARRGTVSQFSVVVPYDHAADDAHRVAAEAFRDRYFPGEPLTYAGEAADGNGDVYSIRAIAIEPASV